MTPPKKKTQPQQKKTSPKKTPNQTPSVSLGKLQLGMYLREGIFSLYYFNLLHTRFIVNLKFMWLTSGES